MKPKTPKEKPCMPSCYTDCPNYECCKSYSDEAKQQERERIEQIVRKLPIRHIDGMGFCVSRVRLLNQIKEVLNYPK